MSNTQEYRGNYASGNARVHMGNVNGNQYNNSYNYHNTYHGHRKPKPPKDTDYGRDLLEAAQAGSLKRTELCLKYDIEVSLTDEEGRTALHWAARKGHDSIARALIDAHCNLDAVSKQSGTPLCEAVIAAKGSIAQLLVEHGAALDLTDAEGRTALHWAASEGHEGIAQVLIDAGCTIDSRSPKHGTPLCQAALGGKEHTARLLLEHGAEFDAACGRHGSALHAACFTGSLQVVKLLLDAGADVNMFRIRGELDRFIYMEPLIYGPSNPQRLVEGTELSHIKCMPLHIANLRKQTQVVDLLLSVGANMTAQFLACKNPFKPGSEFWMQSPMHFEVEYGYNEGSWNGSAIHFASASDPTMLEMLVERGAYVNTRLGRTLRASDIAPIHSAALHGNAGCLRVLLDHGALVDLSCRSDYYNTALNLGACHGHMDCVKLLLDRGARADGNQSDFNAPLSSAVLGGHANIAELLLARGASVSLKNENGATALHYARSGECVRLLVRHGVPLDVKEYFRRTPLNYMIWMHSSNLTAIKALLEVGASVHEVDDEEKNAYDYAMSDWDGQEKKQLLAMLKQHGAKQSSFLKRLVNR